MMNPAPAVIIIRVPATEVTGGVAAREGGRDP
jgi:hypothetical protein